MVDFYQYFDMDKCPEGLKVAIKGIVVPPSAKIEIYYNGSYGNPEIRFDVGDIRILQRHQL